jgi:hypothetical protein
MMVLGRQRLFFVGGDFPAASETPVDPRDWGHVSRIIDVVVYLFGTVREIFLVPVDGHDGLSSVQSRLMSEEASGLDFGTQRTQQ